MSFPQTETKQNQTQISMHGVQRTNVIEKNFNDEHDRIKNFQEH